MRLTSISFAILSSSLFGFGVQAAPKVVSSLPPVHALVEQVMEGVGNSSLIVQGAASGHGFQLKPSDIQTIQQADLVFWVGPSFETFLTKPLKEPALAEKSVPLVEVSGLKLLKIREGEDWERHDHDHEEHDDHDDHDHDKKAHKKGHEHDHHEDHDDHDHDKKPHHDAHDDHLETDPHFWLDVDNAKLMVKAIADKLTATDPTHAATYQSNATKTLEALGQLDQDLAAKLAKVNNRPFIVFHDATQYLEVRYQLKAVGAITISPDRPASAQKLTKLKNLITEQKVVCVFAEPQFKPVLVEKLVAGTSAKTGILDPEAATLKPGPQLYGQLLHQVADQLNQCLGN